MTQDEYTTIRALFAARAAEVARIAELEAALARALEYSRHVRDTARSVMTWQRAVRGEMPDYPMPDAIARLWDAEERWRRVQ